jgi:hypothetical protein
VPIVRLLQDQGFSDAQTAALGAAFDAAWQVFKTRHPDLANGALTATSRETLAKFIVDEAKKGETNPARLVDRALIRFADHP